MIVGNLIFAQRIVVSIKEQTLRLFEEGSLVFTWPVSTALAGAGNQENSGKTPLGSHRIRAKIGAEQPVNSVFVGRRATGEIYSASLAQQYPDRDWILTRILWLCGNEIGHNRLGSVDSMRRYIYIHGTPDSEPMGIPLSHGCVRMRNDDVASLFDRVSVGTQVIIGS